jgi:hypothetical protein
MSDVPVSPSAGAAALTGRAPTVDWQGATWPASELTLRNAVKLSNAGLAGMLYTKTFTVVELSKSTKAGIGYLPAGVTCVGFVVMSDDLDTGTAALVQSIFIGDTEVATGLTTGQAGTGGIFPCLPTRVDVATPIYFKTTTAAATRAAGSVSVTALYYSS